MYSLCVQRPWRSERGHQIPRNRQRFARWVLETESVSSTEATGALHSQGVFQPLVSCFLDEDFQSLSVLLPVGTCYLGWPHPMLHVRQHGLSTRVLPSFQCFLCTMSPMPLIKVCCENQNKQCKRKPPKTYKAPYKWGLFSFLVNVSSCPF